MSTIEDFPSATFAVPRDDVTVVSAWASSPLGDPAIEDGHLPGPAKFEDYPPTTVTAKPRSRGTNALVAAAVVAATAMVAGLGLMLIDGTGSKPQKPAAVVPNSSVGSVTPHAPSAVSPSSAAPAPPSVATAPDVGQPATGPASGGDAPVLTGPAPAPAGGAAPADPGVADPGTPPPPPSVTVNIPPVVPVPIPIPLPPHQGGAQQGGGHPPIGGAQGPIECIPCHQQPIHQQPIHRQPIQQQPIQQHH